MTRGIAAVLLGVLLLAGCDCGRKDGCFGDGRYGEPTPASTGGAR